MNGAAAVGAGLLGVAAGPYLAVAARRSLHTRSVSIPAVPVTVASAGLGVAFGARYGGEWELPAYLVLAAALVVLAVVDLVELRLPNRVLGPAAVVVAVLLAGGALVGDDGAALLRAVGWSAGATITFAVLHLLSPRGLGMGDVKLVALLGFAVGAQGGDAVLLALLLAFGAGATAALVLLVAGRVRGRDPLPFGPFLAAGTLAALLVSGGA